MYSCKQRPQRHRVSVRAVWYLHIPRVFFNPLEIEQLMVCFLDGSVTVFDIQMCTSRVNIFCKVGAAVMSNDTVTGHCADCSFYRRHLLKCGCLIGILFAAAAAGFVTFAKSNAKALLTAELSKAHCALRGGMRLLRKPLPSFSACV